MHSSAAKKEHIMMDGSESSKSYLLIGRKGTMAIGIKVLTPMSAALLGSPGNTYFSIKLRIAPGKDLLEAPAAAEGQVVSLADHATFDSPAAALPEIAWDKKSSARASVVVGVILRGNIKDGFEALCDQIEGGKLAGKITARLAELVGLDHLILTQREITVYLDGYYQKLIAQVKQSAAMEQKAKEVVEEAIGIVDLQAALAKKIYDATKAAAGISDKEEQSGEEEDEEEDEEDETQD